METTQPSRYFRFFHLKEPTPGGFDHFTELFEKERLHFSNPAYFNDPFDCLPCLKDFTPRAIEQAFESNWQTCIEKVTLEGKSKGFRLDPNKVEAVKKLKYAETEKALTKEIVHDKFAPNFLKALGERFGVLCLCGNITTNLMWSHYADNHKGMAVELNLSRLNLENCEVLPIDYSSPRRPILPANGAMKPELARFKSEEWRYEEETRIICSLSDLSSDNNRHFLKIPLDAISHVYLGWMFWAAPDDVKKSQRFKCVLDTLKSRGFLDRRQVSIMSPSESDYTLDPTPLQSFESLLL